MAKLARLPRFDRTGGREPAEHRAPRLRTRYYAFLSYSHKDKELADWLHRELEKFRVPHSLAGKLTANGVVPRRLVPIFRDEQELSAGDDLAVEIEAALAASQFLIVLCSPTAATSRWTNLEIESFKRTRPEGCVLAAVAAGEPFASDIPGREHDECFPPALRYRYDRRGHRTAKRAEPLASDFREGGDGRRLAFLKLIAGMLGVGLDELVQRATTRRQRRLALLAAASLGGMAVTSTLAVTAIRARDAAREQRREAEGLISFMLGDLKDKLEPIGRLDALDGVGSRVLDYYQKEGTADLSDAALTQRSQALSLMAEVANLRGDISTSLRLYRAAMVGTAEAIRRDPKNPQLLFEHAQNVFYVGQIAQQQADLLTAEAEMREYQRLALKMVALAPDNMKWRMEENYADFNLGVVLFGRRKFAEATRQFEQSSKTIAAIATADPANLDYRASTAESLAWLSDSLDAQGRFGEAIQARQRDIALLNGLVAQTHDNDYRHRLVHADRRLGNLYAELGRTDLALQQFRSAADLGQQLVAVEPDNTRWLEYAASARLDLGKYLLLTGATGEAAANIRSGCAIFTTLVRRHAPPLPGWRWRSVSCSLLEARLSLASGNKADAAQLVRQAIAAAKSIHSGEPVTDALQVAAIDREAGDVADEAGEGTLARQAWAAAFAAYPRGVAETPATASEHAMILQRVGRSNDAQQLRQQLAGLGFKDPAFRANGGKGNV
ncbi:MAG TPA: TIR domain-containing protein [Sphingomicrobium sp.]|nr:TIR domain-containing protein [Sphingomicrobium sp.]